MKSNLLKQSLILTMGYPGAGKTFVARQLSEKLGIPVISADRVRFDLFEEPQYTRDEDAVVYRMVDYMVEEMIKAGLSVICDGDYSLRKSRRLKYELAASHQLQPMTIWVQTDGETSFSRAAARDGRRQDDKYSPSIDQETFERLVNKMKRPSGEPAVVISGKHIFKVQYRTIRRKMEQLRLLQPSVNAPQARTLPEAPKLRAARSKAPLQIDMTQPRDSKNLI